MENETRVPLKTQMIRLRGCSIIKKTEGFLTFKNEN